MHSLQEYLLITGFKQQSPPSNLHSKLFDMSSQKPSPIPYQFSQSEKKKLSHFNFQDDFWHENSNDLQSPMSFVAISSVVSELVVISIVDEKITFVI